MKHAPCDGTGFLPCAKGIDPPLCPYCNGTGKVPEDMVERIEEARLRELEPLKNAKEDLDAYN